MFKRFTERARRVIILAREEAEKYRHEYLGTEHILSGILKDGSGIAVAALRKMNVDLEELGLEITRRYPESSQNFNLGDIPFTARAKKVLEYSVEEARSMGHNYIGTEHILLGLIKEKDGMASTVLKRFGVNYADIREQVLNFFKEPATGAEPGTKTPALDEFARDLTKLAILGKLDPVIGRTKEIERVIHIISRRTKNNPILIGEPGVGKTAIVEGLARRIVDKEVPETLYGKSVLCLDIGLLVAGTKYRGQFEARMKAIMKEIRDNKQVILFIDELHTIIGAGSAEGSLDASNMLKPALSRGEIQCIGATTLEEYRKYIEKHGALERRFQPVMVNPPSIEETIEIIRGLKVEYEIHHAAKISDEAITEAVKLADRYISDRFLPDKAIDVIDEAGSRVRLRKSTYPPEIRETVRKIDEINREKKNAIDKQDFEKAVELRDKEEDLQALMESLKQTWKDQRKEDEEPIVTVDDIAYVVSNMTGIPPSRMEKGEVSKLQEMAQELQKRIVGQEEAIEVVSKAIRRSRAGLKDRGCPIGSFLFIGPTGVGKTELANLIAEFLFGDKNALIRLDMSEYSEKINATRITGAPPGYVGFDEGGQLCEKVRRKPYSVILFDEIEKAHSDIYNILLQIMDDGRLTDNYGRHISFKNALLIMTSNLNTREIEKGTTLGFHHSDAPGSDDSDKSHEKMKGILMGELKKTFNPEFLNRLTEIIVFRPLKMDHIEKIVELQLTEINKKLIEKGLSLHIEEDAKKWLAKEGYHATYGARPLKRHMQKYIEDPLSDELLGGEYKEGGVIDIGLQNEKLTFIYKKDIVGSLNQ